MTQGHTLLSLSFNLIKSHLITFIRPHNKMRNILIIKINRWYASSLNGRSTSFYERDKNPIQTPERGPCFGNEQEEILWNTWECRVSIFEVCTGFMENNSSVTLSGLLREVKNSSSFFVQTYMWGQCLIRAFMGKKKFHPS